VWCYWLFFLTQALDHALPLLVITAELDGDASSYQLRVKVAVVHLDGRHRLAGASPSSVTSSSRDIGRREGGLRLSPHLGNNIGNNSRSNSVRRPTSAKIGSTFKLFVAHLPRQFSEDQVADLFSPFGTILDIYILRHYDTQASKVGQKSITLHLKHTCYKHIYIHTYIHTYIHAFAAVFDLFVYSIC
jgi:hypothetical protein